MKVFTLAIFAYLTLGLIVPQKETIIIGHVINCLENKYATSGIIIELKDDTFIVAGNYVNPDGTFIIKTKSDKKLDLYYNGVGVHEKFIQTISQGDKDTILVTIEIPKKYKKRFGHAVCPKCNKHDMTIPIQYGLGSAVLILQVDNNGDTTYLNYDKKNYYAGSCTTSEFDPQWYCKRDKIQF